MYTLYAKLELNPFTSTTIYIFERLLTEANIEKHGSNIVTHVENIIFLIRQLSAGL